MYECIMDMKNYGGEGVLLADESKFSDREHAYHGYQLIKIHCCFPLVGLGKTLQVCDLSKINYIIFG